MKRRDILILAMVAIISGILSLVMAGSLLGSARRTDKVPLASPISETLPDLKNDSSFNKFLNPQALDPTQPVPVGGNNPKVFQ